MPVATATTAHENGANPELRRDERGFGIPAPFAPLYPPEIAGEESGWWMSPSDSSAALGKNSYVDRG